MKQLLRSLTKGCYDIQELRIQMGNRIVANFKTKLGIEPGTKEKESQADTKKVLNTIRSSYNRMTDGVQQISKRVNFEYDGVISNFSELCLIDQYIELLTNEKAHFRRLENTLGNFEIWTAWLSDVKGVGPAMGAVIVSEIDIEKAKYVSSIWKYAGLDVVDGEGRTRQKKHLVEIEYQDSEGETKTKLGITFNPFLKTKLIGVLGPCLKRAKDHYAGVYDDYRHRIDNEKKHQKKSDGHRHNMAVRYMVKMFLKDLYAEWKQIEGLPQHPTYQEAKLGHTHNSHANSNK